MSKWGMLGAKKAQVEEVIEIPFDLNKIFNLSYGFEPLKEVITDLYKQTQGNQKKVGDLDMKLSAKFMEISQ